MKKVLFIFGLAIFFWMVIIASIAFSQVTQNTSRWDLHAGIWDFFDCYADATTEDSIWFAYGDTVFTEEFKCWPWMSVEALVVDTTSATDSIYNIVKFVQSGEAVTSVNDTFYVQVKNLSWRSTTSVTEADTLSAVGRYYANLTEEPIYVGRWGRFMIISPTGCKKLGGNFMKLHVNGWNDR